MGLVCPSTATTPNRTLTTHTQTMLEGALVDLGVTPSHPTSRIPTHPTLQTVLEGDLVNLGVTSPAAALALGLMYLQTNDAAVATAFHLPGRLEQLGAWAVVGFGSQCSMLFTCRPMTQRGRSLAPAKHAALALAGPAWWLAGGWRGGVVGAGWVDGVGELQAPACLVLECSQALPPSPASPGNRTSLTPPPCRHSLCPGLCAAGPAGAAHADAQPGDVGLHPAHRGVGAGAAAGPAQGGLGWRVFP